MLVGARCVHEFAELFNSQILTFVTIARLELLPFIKSLHWIADDKTIPNGTIQSTIPNGLVVMGASFIDSSSFMILSNAVLCSSKELQEATAEVGSYIFYTYIRKTFFVKVLFHLLTHVTSTFEGRLREAKTVILIFLQEVYE